VIDFEGLGDLPGYTDQPPSMQSLNGMLASIEAYRAERGPVLREIRCQAPVREHLADTLSRGTPPPSYLSAALFGIPLIDDSGVPDGLLRFVYDGGTVAEIRVLAPATVRVSLSDWLNSLLPPQIADCGFHWSWIAADEPVPAFLPAGQRAMLAGGNRHAEERIAEWRERSAQVPAGDGGGAGCFDGGYQYDAGMRIIGDDAAAPWHGRTEPLYWGEALTPADSNTPHAGSMTCAHICGPDPDHVCDARAVTFLEHANLAGGVTRMPVCGPCGTAEKTATEGEHA
jgi:hypothetical protein